MGENVKVEDKKKKKLPLIIILSVVAVFVIAFGTLCVTGLLPIPTSEGVINLNTALLIKEADNVQDEATLRELLLLDRELEITVTKDIQISDTLIVNGTKTLKGDAEISYNITGLFAQSSIMEVKKNAHLIMDGLVLNGEGMADAVTVNQRAELTYKSGTIEYVRYGISSNGKVTIDDATIQHTATAAIFANFRSDVVVNKGYFYNSYNTTLQIENGGSMEIYEGVLIEQSGGTAINNLGDLLVYGCTIKDTVGNGINNQGNMTIEYKGSKADGMIEMENIGKIALRIASSDNTNIKDVHVNGTGTNGVFVTDLVTKGSLTLSDCVFENTGDESGNTFSIAGNATIKDVTIKGSQKGSFYVRAGAKVNAQNITIENCTGVAMDIQGKLTADGITINGATSHGITLSKSEKAFGEAILSDVHISGVSKNALLVRVGCSMEVKDAVIDKTNRTSVYVSNEGTMTLENVEIKGVIDKGLWCVTVCEKANLTVKGDTTITGGTRGGICVEKNATCTMESGKISGINATGDGGAVYLRGEGTVFNFVGGTLSNNISAKAGGAVYVGAKATFNMKGGTISGNKATNRGGAVYVLGTMNFTGGTMKGNESKTSANGILCKGNVIVSGNAYMAKDDIGVDSVKTIPRVKGSSLKKHSKSEPLLVTAPRDTAPGTKIVECDSNNAAIALAGPVASGTKAYSLYQVDKHLAVSANKADMSMTGADKVYVSTFKEFKEAVETTKDKRYVIVAADIAFESEVFVPLGATVYVRDDGQTRTLSRKDDMGSNLISTSYGTGLYLVGTSQGKLVVDGTTSAAKAADKIDPAVRVYGGTEIRNVAFKNNLTSENGAFVRHDYGDTAIYSSTFTGGKSTNHGGAVSFASGTAIIENCVFEDNDATKEGGAIRANNNKELSLTIKTSEFRNNTAGTIGGAISTGAGNLVVTSSNFTDNVAKTGHAGAISAVNAVSAVINGTGTFKGNRATSGGAIYTNNSIIAIDGYTFDDNTAETGGAIAVNAGTSNGADPIQITNAVFTNNTATSNGGAIHNAGRTTDITNSTFEGNTAENHGGAAYISNGGTLNFVGSDAAKAVFEQNTAKGNGGAVYTAKNGTLIVEGYAFNSNSAASGGAINTTKDSKAATITNSTFAANQANGQGGAIRADGDENTVTVVTIKDTTFADHTATASGGAIYTKAETHLENASFTNNSGAVGGAINACGGREFTATSCIFASNKSTRATSEGGGAVIITAGTKAILDGTGSFTSNESAYDGGAIYTAGSEVTITGYTFESNGASTKGGAISNSGSTVKIIDSTFGSEGKGNTSVGNGGAIYSAGMGTLVMEGKTADKAVFAGNIAGSETKAANGGAICVGSGILTITGYTFDNNQTYGTGGAINLNNDSRISANLTGTTFVNNKANYYKNADNENEGGTGGAIHYNIAQDTDKVLKLTDCTFGKTDEGNSAAGHGGALWLNTHAVTEITGSEFVANNTANNRGGAIYNGSNKTTTIVDTTFKANTANQAGAILHNSIGELVLKTDKSPDKAVFEGNSGYNGGAIRTSTGGKITITGYKFISNTASNNGGAICVDTNAVLDITNATFGAEGKGNTAGNAGGAVYFTGSAKQGTIKNSIFVYNSASNTGGAIHDNGTESNTINNSVFTSNSAPMGGAINCYASALTATSCTFTDNLASTEGVSGLIGRGGGAVNVARNATAIFNGTGSFTSNTAAKAWGGAIYVTDSKLEVTGYTFGQNSALHGGAVMIDNVKEENDAALASDQFKFTDVTFTNNQATNGNAGAVYNKRSILFTNVKVSGNTATSTGGAIYIGNSGTFEAVGTDTTKAIFENNSGSNGGAICIGSGTLKVTGYKFTGNHASTSGTGGAINLNNNTGIQTNLTECIFEQNTAKDGGAIHSNVGSATTKTLEITDCKFDTNSATGNGGAINSAGSIDINIKATANGKVEALFTGNHANGNGGAIQKSNKSDGDITITGYTFKLNTADGQGGAICNYNGVLTVTDCVFGGENAGNSSSGNGGTIYNGSSGHVKLIATGKQGTQALFQGNSTTNGYGGVVGIGTGNLTIEGYKFMNNTASSSGGAIHINSGSSVTNITGAEFTGNSTSTSGGAIRTMGTCTITGTSFTKNTATQNGGAIYLQSHTLNVNNCTFGTTDETKNSPQDIYKNGGTLNNNGSSYTVAP